LELIQRYEENLQTIQTANRSLIQRASQTDTKIAPVYQLCIVQRDIWGQLVRDFSTLNDVQERIDSVKSEVEKICERMDLLEMALTEQTEAATSVELQTWKDFQVGLTLKHHQKQQKEVEGYEQELRIAFVKREQQRLELEKLKIQQQMEEQRIRAKEKEREDRFREQQLALERQREEQKLREQLQQQFQKDMDTYKAYGTLPVPVATANTTLENVQLPSDPSIEDFLGPSEPKKEEEVADEDKEPEKKVEILPVIETPEEVRQATAKDGEKVDVDESWYT